MTRSTVNIFLDHHCFTTGFSKRHPSLGRIAVSSPLTTILTSFTTTIRTHIMTGVNWDLGTYEVHHHLMGIHTSLICTGITGVTCLWTSMRYPALPSQSSRYLLFSSFITDDQSPLGWPFILFLLVAHNWIHHSGTGLCLVLLSHLEHLLEGRMPIWST